ncbi:hypothetical protein [Sneathiella sp.]|uniref:hypothetical protein n=1 Tax=Sneathiella sp. TaxID=1964365 RepID=UPI0035664887
MELLLRLNEADNRIREAVEKTESIQQQLFGNVRPGTNEKEAEGKAHAVFPRISSSADSICRLADRLHEVLDAINESLTPVESRDQAIRDIAESAREDRQNVPSPPYGPMYTGAE